MFPTLLLIGFSDSTICEYVFHQMVRRSEKCYPAFRMKKDIACKIERIVKQEIPMRMHWDFLFVVVLNLLEVWRKFYKLFLNTINNQSSYIFRLCF